MPDTAPPTDEAAAEMRLVQAAVAVARAQPNAVPHETVRTEMLCEIARLERRVMAKTSP